MKKLIGLIVLIIFASFIFLSCEEDSTKGSITLSITDAPIDNSTVVGVYLTITEIQYHKNNDWLSFENFEGPRKFNIMELTNGNSALVGSFELDAGTYTQLRFILDAPEYGMPNLSNPGCYIEFADESQEPLFVPSGSETGWKGVGGFTVPSNGNVEVTADFDARKSVIKAAASGKYILKPTIRLIVDNQAGQISGSITNIPIGVNIIIFAYEDGAYNNSEADDPMNDTTSRFPNAVTSSIADDSYSYNLVYLAPMIYDLVVTTAINGEFQEVLGVYEDVVVESKKTANQLIDISTL
jgi:hypothetical protein